MMSSEFDLLNRVACCLLPPTRRSYQRPRTSTCWGFHWPS